MAAVWCLIISQSLTPTGNTFKVTLENEDDIARLKERVKEKKAPFLNHVAANLLTIWRRTDPENILDDNCGEVSEDSIKDLFHEKKVEQLGARKKIGALDIKEQETLFVEVPTDGNILRPDSNQVHMHIDSSTSETVSGSPSRKRLKLSKTEPDETINILELDDEGVRVLERWRSKRHNSRLPTIAELAGIADLPLLENEKIPISARRFRSLINTAAAGATDFCSLEDVQVLFRVGHTESLLDEFFFTISRSPPVDGPKESFHSFWDRNVRKVLQLLIPHGKSIRNGNHPATRRLRPDYAFLLNKFCPFRGEEKSSENMAEDPKRKLADKLVWTYSPAPYVLGYYAEGPDLTLAAISPSQLQQHGRPLVTDIVHVDLQFRKNRIKNIRHIINLAGIISSLSDLVRPLDAEFDKINGDDGNTVEIAGRNIIKTYNGLDKHRRVAHLRSIYQLLHDKKVPHVDSLEHHHDTTVILSPRGTANPPKTEQELLAALICVLEALEVLHQSPNPLYHRDIRWPNVMRRLDNPQGWFIIDWEDAASPPTTAQSHFNQSTHSPLAFVDNHGAEVDIWGVGHLILDCDALGISLALRNLGRWMQGEVNSAPSASEALKKVKEYKEYPQDVSYTTRQ